MIAALKEAVRPSAPVLPETAPDYLPGRASKIETFIGGLVDPLLARGRVEFPTHDKSSAIGVDIETHSLPDDYPYTVIEYSSYRYPERGNPNAAQWGFKIGSNIYDDRERLFPYLQVTMFMSGDTRFRIRYDEITDDGQRYKAGFGFSTSGIQDNETLDQLFAQMGHPIERVLSDLFDRD